MLNKLSKGIVEWQIQRKYLSNEERELYEYAYEVLINQIINIIAAILIAVFMHALIHVFVFLVCYIPLRSYCGGYHAKTNIGCTCISALVIYFMCLLEKTIAVKIENFWLIIGFFVAGLIIFILAPVQDNNKPLDFAELIQYRKTSRLIWLIECILGCSLGIWFHNIIFVIVLSQLILSIMLCIGLIKNKKKHEAN